MKGLISLAVVVAFFVTIPQCLGQSQDACQLLEEQPLAQMSLLLIAPTTSVAVPVQGRGQGPQTGCIKTCGDTKKEAQKGCRGLPRQERKVCRDIVEADYDNCSLCCHSSCSDRGDTCSQYSFCP